MHGKQKKSQGYETKGERIPGASKGTALYKSLLEWYCLNVFTVTYDASGIVGRIIKNIHASVNV